MKLRLKILLLSAMCTVFACNNPQSKNEERYRGPKTSYGQNVKRAKDLSKELSKNDEELKNQAARLADEN